MRLREVGRKQCQAMAAMQSGSVISQCRLGWLIELMDVCDMLPISVSSNPSTDSIMLY